MIRFIQNGGEILSRQHWAIQLAMIVGSAATVAVMTNALFAADAYSPPAVETTAAQRQLLLRAPVAQWQGQTLKEGTIVHGDTGNDGKVNGIDYSTLASHYGENYPQADLNYDGVVNAEDMALLQASWTW